MCRKTHIRPGKSFYRRAVLYYDGHGLCHALVRHTVGRELTPERRAKIKAQIEAAAGIIDPERKPVAAVPEGMET
jgi:hypothetical protein